MADQQMHPTDLSNLVAFWDFQEPLGLQCVSRGRCQLALLERPGPVARVDGGVWGTRALQLREGQWLQVPRANCEALDIHGPEATVSVIAWLQRDSDRPWQYIAGCWDHAKTTGLRQYALYTSGRLKTDDRDFVRTEAVHQAHGFVSDVGGPTPGHPACLTYATGATTIEKNCWYTIGFTYDGQRIRVYVNGVLDALPHHNPFRFAGGVFDGGRDGGDFTIAHRPNRQEEPEAGPVATRFTGLLGGVAVYDRALTGTEMAGLHRAP